MSELFAQANFAPATIARARQRPAMSRRLTRGDEFLRNRIRAWVGRYYEEYKAEGFNQRRFAETLGISPGHLSELLSGKGSCGLDFVVSLARNVAGKNIYIVLTEDPPASNRQTQRPAEASPVAVEPRKRKGADG